MTGYEEGIQEERLSSSPAKMCGDSLVELEMKIVEAQHALTIRSSPSLHTMVVDAFFYI